MLRLPPSVSPLWRSYFLVLCLSWTTVVCYGQNPQPSALRVVVKDAQDLPVPGAVCSVSPRSLAKRPAVTTRSNDQGIANFANITPGAYTLHATVLDASGTQVSRAYTLAINPAGLSITTTSQLPIGVAGHPYVAVLGVQEGTAPYHWTASSLPA